MLLGDPPSLVYINEMKNRVYVTCLSDDKLKFEAKLISLEI